MKTKYGKTRHSYQMDYISDKDLFLAVKFAAKMIHEGTSPGIAYYRAAAYYGVNKSDVAHYVGQRAGRSGSTRR